MVYNIKTKFNGDTQYLPSESNIIEVNVAKEPQIVEIDITNKTYNLNDPVVVNVYCHSSGTNKIPVETGTVVTLWRNGASAGTGTLNSQGKCTINSTMNVNGTNTFQIKSPATATFSNADSEIKSFGIGQQNTTINVSASATSIDYNSSSTINVSLRNQNNQAISGKTITYKIGSTVIGTATTNSSGIASLGYKFTTIGTNKVDVSFSGDTTYNASTGYVNITVNKITTNLTVIGTVSPNTIYRGWDLKVKATDSTGAILTGKTLTMTINDVNYSVTTNSYGIANRLVEIVGSTTNYSVNLPATTTQNAATITGTLTLLDGLTIEKKPMGVDGGTDNIPFRSWSGVWQPGSDPYGEPTDNYGATCGTNCSSSGGIGTAGGSRNTPAPLTNYNFDFSAIPVNSVINNVEAIWIHQHPCGVSTSQINCGAGSMFFIQNGVAIGVANGNNNPGTQSYTQSDNDIVFSSQVNSNDLKSNNFSVRLEYSKNTTGNTGQIRVSWVSIKVTYVPPQP